MFFISASYFLDGYHETLSEAEFIAPDYFADRFEYLIAVTHRWEKPLLGDLGSVNFLDLRNRISWLIEPHSFKHDDIAIFYDYCSIYQSASESDLIDLTGRRFSLHGRQGRPHDIRGFFEFGQAQRRKDLDRLYPMILCADEVYMTKHRQRDYYTRCWCLVEAFAGRLRGVLVDRSGPFRTAEIFTRSTAICRW